MRHVLFELAYLIGGLIVVAAITETAAWSYPPGRAAIVWIGWLVAVGVLVWSIPGFLAARAKDRAKGRVGD